MQKNINELYDCMKFFANYAQFAMLSDIALFVVK